MSSAPVNTSAAAKQAKGATNSYQVKEALANTIAASGSDGSNVPMLDNLLALKTLMELSPDGAKGKDLWQTVINKETSMLRVAANTLKDNPALEEKMGGGLQSIMALSGLLRQKHSDAILDDILKKAVTGNEGLGLEDPSKRLTRLNTTKAITS